MIDVTPQTDADTEVNIGDTVRVRWLFNANVDPQEMTLTVEGFDGTERTFTGSEISEEEVTKDDQRYWRYYRDFTLQSLDTKARWTLERKAGYSDAADTTSITAQP